MLGLTLSGVRRMARLERAVGLVAVAAGPAAERHLLHERQQVACALRLVQRKLRRRHRRRPLLGLRDVQHTMQSHQFQMSMLLCRACAGSTAAARFWTCARSVHAAHAPPQQPPQQAATATLECASVTLMYQPLLGLKESLHNSGGKGSHTRSTPHHP